MVQKGVVRGRACPAGGRNGSLLYRDGTEWAFGDRAGAIGRLGNRDSTTGLSLSAAVGVSMNRSGTEGVSGAKIIGSRGEVRRDLRGVCGSRALAASGGPAAGVSAKVG